MLYFLLVHELAHVLGGVLIGLRSGKLRDFLLAVGVSLVVDADHFIDLFLWNKGKFYLFDVFSADYFRQSGKLYIFFHAYEYVLLLIILARWNKIFLVVALALLGHLIIDQLSYGPLEPNYFLLYRLFNNFSH